MFCLFWIATYIVLFLGFPRNLVRILTTRWTLSLIYLCWGFPIWITMYHQIYYGLLLRKTPSPGEPFTYLTTLNVVIQCDCLGCFINWISSWTTKQMSSPVIVKYINFLLSFWYLFTSSNKGSSLYNICSSCSIDMSLMLDSKGVKIGLAFVSPTSDISSNVYFLWFSKILCWELNTLISKIYISTPPSP